MARTSTHTLLTIAGGLWLLSMGLAQAQQAATKPADAATKPDPLVIYFDTGSAAVRPQDLAVLDRHHVSTPTRSHW